jgi:hypothetical protein
MVYTYAAFGPFGVFGERREHGVFKTGGEAPSFILLLFVSFIYHVALICSYAFWRAFHTTQLSLCFFFSFFFFFFFFLFSFLLDCLDWKGDDVHIWLGASNRETALFHYCSPCGVLRLVLFFFFLSFFCRVLHGLECEDALSARLLFPPQSPVQR